MRNPQITADILCKDELHEVVWLLSVEGLRLEKLIVFSNLLIQHVIVGEIAIRAFCNDAVRDLTVLEQGR